MNNSLSLFRFSSTLSLALITAVAWCHVAKAEAPADHQELFSKYVKGVDGSSEADGHPASAAADGKTSTAWVGKPGDVIGASVTLRLTGLRNIDWIEIHPGLGVDTASFKNHARPTKVKVSWPHGEQVFSLKNANRRQDLDLIGTAHTDSLTITVLEAAGPPDAPLAITEIKAFESFFYIRVKTAIRQKISAAVLKLSDPELAPETETYLRRRGDLAIPWYVAEMDRGLRPGMERAFRVFQKVDKVRARLQLFRALQKGIPQAALIAAEMAADDGLVTLSDELYATFERLNGPERFGVLLALAKLKDKRVLESVIAGIVASEPAMMEIASEALSGYGKKAVKRLTALAKDRDDTVRRNALTTLAGMQGDAALKALTSLVTAEQTREQTLDALKTVKGPMAVRVLTEMSLGPPSELRDQALGSLVTMGPSAVRGLVVESLDRGAQFSTRVLDALTRTQQPEVRNALVEVVLAGGDQKGASEVQGALAAHGRAGVEAVLDVIARRPELAQRGEAFLKRSYASSAPVVVARLRTMKTDRELDPLRAVMLAVIGHAQLVSAADLVVDIYRAKGSSVELKVAAIKAAGELSKEETRRVVRDALQSDNPTIADAGLEGAIKLRDNEAASLVVAKLRRTPHSDWTETAIRALGKMGARVAIPLFREALPKLSRGLQFVVLEATRRVGGSASSRLLVEYKFSDDVELSLKASELLREER